jgi:hypothetical protein
MSCQFAVKKNPTYTSSVVSLLDLMLGIEVSQAFE